LITISLVVLLAVCTVHAQDVTRVADLAAKVDSTLRRINARTESARTPGLASVRIDVPAARTPEQPPTPNKPAGEGVPAKPLTIEDRLAALETAPPSAMSPEVTQLLGDLRKAVDELRAKTTVPAEVFPSIKVGLLSQFHAQALQEQTTAQQDLNSAYTRHWQRQLYIRRLRVLVGGNVTKNTSFFFESDATNIGRVAATGSKTNGVSMYVQDAQVVHSFMPELSFIVGLHLVGISRNGLQGATTLMGVNYGSYQFTTSTPLDNSVGRDLGITARGFLADERLEYRAGVYSGRNVNLYSPLRSAVRLQYCFLDREKGFFYTGTTLGKGHMFNIGAGVDLQGSYRGYSADAFLDLPVGDAGALTVSASAGSFDGRGSDVDSTAFTGLVPKQSILFLEAGYLFRDLNLQPYFKYESQNVHADVLKQVGATAATLQYQNTLRSGDRWGIGLHYFINGHGASVKAMYEIVSRYRPGLIPGVAERVTNGEATLQVQFYTY
jgi:hypothetical protein